MRCYCSDWRVCTCYMKPEPKPEPKPADNARAPYARDENGEYLYA